MAELHVESTGAGRPLVMLHGWAMHGGVFAPIVSGLARTHRVHVVDLPGHGRSAALSPWTLEGVVGALAARFGASAPLRVLGWSLGGLVAMAWALAAPPAIDRLVLVSSTPAFVAREGWPDAMARDTLHRFGDELRVAWRATLLRFLSLQVQGSENGRATLAQLRDDLFGREPPDQATLAQALAVLETADLRDAVPAIAQPTLVVQGDRDALVPPGAATWLAEALPRSRTALIAGAAHAPFLSHRADFLARLQDFLDE